MDTDPEFWDMVAKAIPVLATVAAGFAAYMGKKAMESSRKANETSEQTKVLVAENTAITEQIQHDVEVVKATTSGETPVFVPQKRS